MNVFGNYARYYNLLYKDKDYENETTYVERLISRFGSSVHSILDLGCGTGRHLSILNRHGFETVGVDQSELMLSIAKKNAPDISFHTGDIRTVRLKRTFDCVVSLFHVMSYQVSNDALTKSFSSACVHCKKNGLFIFDCWYGPAVLTDRPAVRVKILEDESTKVVRTVHPTLHADKNTVDVKYNLYITEKKTRRTEELDELHCMRYLFTPEIESYLSLAGFKLLHSEEWLTGKDPGVDTWGVCFIARKI